MKRRLFSIVLLWGILQSALAVDSGARFFDAGKEVEVRSSSSSPWTQADSKTPLQIGDRIRTGRSSGAIFGFSDSSTLVLKPDSEIVIEESGADRVLVRLVAGNLWVNLKKMAATGKLEVELNSATVSIKGTNITCNSNRNGGVETDIVTTLRGEADVTVRNTGEHFVVSEGQQVAVRGGQVIQNQVDSNQSGAQWNQQLQNMGSNVDLGDIPSVLRNIRENEGSLIRNLRSSLEGANRENVPALLRAVDRALGVLDEDSMTMNNFMRRVREAASRANQALVGPIADALRGNASFRTDVGAMLRQLRQIESLELVEIPGRLESIRSSLSNGMTSIREANAAIPEVSFSAACTDKDLSRQTR